MNHAYILVQASPGTSFEVLSTVREIKGVKQAHAIMGPTDGIVFVETADLEELAETVMAIRAVNGVASTDTRFAWPF